MTQELCPLRTDVLEIIPELTRAAAVGGRVKISDNLSREDWEQILGICAAQRIHTFVYDALPECNIPEDIRSLWESQVKANEKASELVNAIVNAQEEAWKKRGLKYALLKGPAVSALYPKPSHRHCGDIDWWFEDEDSWQTALELAKKNAEGRIHTDSDGDINYVFKGVVIEHHRDWTHLSSRKLRWIVGNPKVLEGRLGPEDTLLSLICHILHHLAWDGVNLKQVVDIAIAYQRYEGQYDKQQFSSKLKKLGLTRLVSLLDSIITDRDCNSKNCKRFLSILLEARPSLFSRMKLMWYLSPRECLARYYYLFSGRIHRTI